MKRTTTRRRREIAAFVSENRRLFPFTLLFLLGVLVGVLIFTTAADRVTESWADLLHVAPLANGLRGGLGALWSSVFSAVVLLCVLFLLGLWPCGAPFVMLVPLFHGLGLGLTQAYYYSLGAAGVRAVALVIMPHGLLTAVVLVMAGVESLRLSTHLCRQLLPSAPCGGLWAVFRLYCLRFLLFLLAAVFAGLLDVLLRVLFARFLP